ncbi:hypothetical protein JDV02_004038 [Purpureocillium takamizusanense]|uniref:Xylanolytic transcriptional activator regulatory domain-containing protein n=1 Tax=Purpureocillium takamizusanense TaxID=2060973 RepID=A0A9Q8QF09_9HYPO|nr:uncharacterized protein JDV02_004038 [Purpureocillium takamizusanense]UNI17716.1 hypothetical protein JDV02_004038 [Purpureocillium takamizusanense]
MNEVALAPEPSHDTQTTGAAFAFSEQDLAGYCAIWFQEYHSWFPILHEPTILETCGQCPGRSDTPVPLVLKAIAAVVVPTQPRPQRVSAAQRQRWLLDLEDDILSAATHDLSLQSLQALLILSIRVFGTGRMAQFYNLMALCKCVSTQLGLRDLVYYHCANYGVPSAIPPRMLFIPFTVVEREEKTRAFWAAEALDSISTLGAAWHLSVPRPEPAATAPCDEETWCFPESVLAAYRFGDAEAPSPFSLFVSLATSELWHVHRFLQQSYDSKAATDTERRQADCDAVYQHLMSWKADFERVLAVNAPPFVDLFSTGYYTDQHPNSILIHCTIHSAVVSLYQRFIVLPDTTSYGGQSWACAADRCIASCESMVALIRTVPDATLESINPYVIFCVFIAARFYAVHARTTGSSTQDKLYLLIYPLTVAAKRWPLARQLKAVLDTAVTESRGEHVGDHPLPVEFYDLQYLLWDIHDALRKWAQAKDQSLTHLESALTA